MSIFSKIEKERGMVARIYSDFQAFPESVEAHFGLNQALMLSQSSPLSRNERELLAYKTSEQNKNVYCASHHKAAYENFKKESEVDNRRRALFEKLAETLTTNPNAAPSLRQEFLVAGISEAEWQHAVNIVAYFNYTNRLAFAMNIQLEQGYEKSCN
jgi:uncharacterized peroxidase-related enzyme